ncbi:Secernin-2, partial [Araneus ventricosus]
DLEKVATEKGLWNPKRAFDFKMVFDVDDDLESPRYKAGKRLLTNFSQTGEFKATDMFKVLRDKPSGICMSSGSFVSTGGQVSVLQKPESGLPSCHWFTATPDPARSVFKPFIFGEDITFPSAVVSPVSDLTTAFSGHVDRKHNLYKLHEEFCIKRKGNLSTLRNHLAELETKYVNLAKDISLNYSAKKADAGKLFCNAVEEESLLYC